MPMYIFTFIKSLIALFVITDSVGNLPFFIGLTEELSKEERRKAFSTALLTGLSLLLIFVFGGTLLLDFFNLTINDLKIAGGGLLFVIAVEILLRGKVYVEHKEEVGIVPLGCPLLVGPGAITTALVLLKIYNFWIVLAAIFTCFFLIWLVLHFAELIYSFLGRNGSLIIQKIAAIIISAIAVQFIREGILAILR